MELFGNKNKKEETYSCCCGGNCDADSMAKAGKAKTEGAGVKVLGSGCAKCNQLEAATKEALVQLGMDTTIDHVTYFSEIAAYGVMTTPALVIDGKVVAAIHREAMPGEFRANIHLGGTASIIKVTAEEKRIAIKATKAMDLKVAGVDIIRSSKGPLLLEVNSSPGLEGIEGATNKDIAGEMIKAIEKNFKFK